MKAGNSACPKTVTGQIIPQYVIHHSDDYDSSVEAESMPMMATQNALSRTLQQKNNQMTKLRVESYTISIDGFGAGTDQSLENPLGVGGTALHGWAFATRTFQAQLFGRPGLWAEICSGQCAVPGLMRAGEDGGVRTRFTIRKFSCSLIILVRHS